MISIYQKSIEETTKQVSDKWANKTQQVILLEIANEQYDQVVNQLRTANPQNLEWVSKYLVRSPFSYDQIRIIIESGFLLNYDEDDDESSDTNGNDSGFNFEGQFFLSSYLIMHYYQNMNYDYKSARKLAFKFLGNNAAIQAYITKLIKSSNTRKISKEIYLESKSSNYQLEQADIKNKLYNKISGQLSNSAFLQNLVRNDSKMDRALSLILPALENKVHLEQAEAITKGLEQYIFSLSFNLLFPEEIEMLFNEIKQYPFERFLRDNIVQEIKNIIKMRQPININPNDESLFYETVTFNYTSIFCQDVQDTIKGVLEKFKNKSIIMIEVCPEQYKEVVLQITSKLNISQKEVQKRVVMSQITQEQISIMIQSGYILNFLKEEHEKVVFSDSHFLSFMLIVYNNHKQSGSWEESFKQGVKHMIAKMNRKQLIKISEDSARRKQMNTFLHPVLKEMIKKVPQSNKIIESIFTSKVATTTSKLLRDNIVTSFGISFISAISDIRKLVTGSLSKRDFLMSQIKNISWTGVDVLARAMGATLGPAGSIAGQFVASQAVDFAKTKLESILPYTIAERASILFEQYLEELTSDILTNEEIKVVINEIRVSGMNQFLKELASNKDENIDLKIVCKEYIKKQIILCLQKRNPIMIGKDPIK